LSNAITIVPDQRTQIEAETIKAGFLDQSFIPTMRFSELNGLEEYDNSILWMVWHGYIEWGLQQVVQYNAWIIRELEVLTESGNVDDLSIALKSPNTKPTLEYIGKLIDNPAVKSAIPYDQRARIYRYFQDLALFLEAIRKKPGIALDSDKIMWLMRTYLASYNGNIADGIVLYDGHYAILNGRMARGRAHKKDLLSVTDNRKDRKPVVEMGKKHFWNRGGDEENG